MTFNDLDFQGNPRNDEIQALHSFPNGYEVSVVRNRFSYGYDDGLYELAVKFNGKCVYDTPVTDDVEGYLGEVDVTRLLGEVSALPQRDPA